MKLGALRRKLRGAPFWRPEATPAPSPGFPCCGGNDETPQEHCVDCPLFDGLAKQVLSFLRGVEGATLLQMSHQFSVSADNIELVLGRLTTAGLVEWRTGRRTGFVYAATSKREPAADD